MIFLDNFTKTAPSSRVAEALLRVGKESNPHFAPYFANKEILREMDEALERIYSFVGASNDDKFVQVFSESEAFLHVLFTIILEKVYKTGKNFILVPCTEGAAITMPLRTLEKIGIETVLLPVDENGRVTVEILKQYKSPKTVLLAMTLANPLTGVIQPVDEIGKYCKEQGILVYGGASEIFSKLFFKFADLDLDFLAFSGDKFHGPPNSGGLFIKGERKDEKTYLKEIKDPAILVGLGIAIDETISYIDTMCLEMARFREIFEEILIKKIPEVVFFGKRAKRLPTTSCFAFPNVSAELLLYHLREKGVIATIGGQYEQRLFFMLQQMQIPKSLAFSALSITMSSTTSEEDVTRAAHIIGDTAQELLRRVNGLL